MNYRRIRNISLIFFTVIVFCSSYNHGSIAFDIDDYLFRNHNIHPRQLIIEYYEDLEQHSHLFEYIPECYDPKFGNADLNIFVLSFSELIQKFFVEVDVYARKKQDYESRIDALIESIHNLKEKVLRCLLCLTNNTDYDCRVAKHNKVGLTSLDAYSQEVYIRKILNSNIVEQMLASNRPKQLTTFRSISRQITNDKYSVPYGMMKIIDFNKKPKFVPNPMLQYPSFRSHANRLNVAESLSHTFCTLKFYTEEKLTIVPESFNYSSAMSPVRNQGFCQSCYILSAIDAIEAHLRIQTETQTVLSTQELLNCIPLACSSGYVLEVFKFVAVFGVTNESRLPSKNTADQNNCVKYPSDIFIRGYCSRRSVKNDRELELYVMEKGPIVVAIDATFMKRLSNERFDGPCDGIQNHAILLIGWENDYWILKNTFGPQWGINGYLYMSKNASCGIREILSFPIL